MFFTSHVLVIFFAVLPLPVFVPLQSVFSFQHKELKEFDCSFLISKDNLCARQRDRERKREKAGEGGGGSVCVCISE